MKKFFVFFIIATIITSCVPNKKILSPEQLTQDKILSEKILGSWKFYPAKEKLYEFDFYKNNTCVWRTIWWNYASQSDDLIKADCTWKIEDSKIKILSTKVNSFWFRGVLGGYSVLSIVEFSDDRIVLKDRHGDKGLMFRQ